MRSRAWSRVSPRASGLGTAYPGQSAAGCVRTRFLAQFRPISSTAMSTHPIPTAWGRRCGAGGRRGCRVRGTCRRGAPKRDQHASLHSKLAEGIGATSATTAGASALLRCLDMVYRPPLSQTIMAGPSHGERMQFCAARLFVAPMDKFAPAWGSPTRRETAENLRRQVGYELYCRPD